MRVTGLRFARPAAAQLAVPWLELQVQVLDQRPRAPFVLTHLDVAAGALDQPGQIENVDIGIRQRVREEAAVAKQQQDTLLEDLLDLLVVHAVRLGADDALEAVRPAPQY